MDAGALKEPARDTRNQLRRPDVVVLPGLQRARVSLHEDLSLALGIQDLVPDDLRGARRDEDVAGFNLGRNLSERWADLSISGRVTLCEVINQALEARFSGDA
jgi:hypothetical protein